MYISKLLVSKDLLVCPQLSELIKLSTVHGRWYICCLVPGCCTTRCWLYMARSVAGVPNAGGGGIYPYQYALIVKDVGCRNYVIGAFEASLDR